MGLAFGGCVGLGIRVSRGGAEARRRGGGQGDRSRCPLGGFLVVDNGWSDRAELHSALHNAGAWADVREPIGRWVGFGLGRFRFWGKVSGAFGGCVRRGIGVSRGDAEARRGQRGPELLSARGGFGGG